MIGSNLTRYSSSLQQVHVQSQTVQSFIASSLRHPRRLSEGSPTSPTLNFLPEWGPCHRPELNNIQHGVIEGRPVTIPATTSIQILTTLHKVILIPVWNKSSYIITHTSTVITLKLQGHANFIEHWIPLTPYGYYSSRLLIRLLISQSYMDDKRIKIRDPFVLSILLQTKLVSYNLNVWWNLPL